MADPEGFEPPTLSLTGNRSTRLSYGPMCAAFLLRAYCFCQLFLSLLVTEVGIEPDEYTLERRAPSPLGYSAIGDAGGNRTLVLSLKGSAPSRWRTASCWLSARLPVLRRLLLAWLSSFLRRGCSAWRSRQDSNLRNRFRRPVPESARLREQTHSDWPVKRVP